MSPLAKETMYVEALRSPPALIETPKVKDEKPPPTPAPHAAPPPASTATALDDLPPVKLEKARDETIEEVQLPRGVQLQVCIPPCDPPSHVARRSTNIGTGRVI